MLTVPDIAKITMERYWEVRDALSKKVNLTPVTWPLPQKSGGRTPLQTCIFSICELTVPDNANITMERY